MTVSEKNIILKTTEKDNVGIAVNPGGLKKGDILNNDLRISKDIPMGHKVALDDIDIGETIFLDEETEISLVEARELDPEVELEDDLGEKILDIADNFIFSVHTPYTNCRM